MRFDVLTLLPEYFEAARLGVTGRAFRELGHGLHLHSYRPFAGNAFGHVDASPFGGGPGMVLRPEVLRDTLAAVPRAGRGRVLHFNPAAPPFTHAKAVELAGLDQVILVCTRFEGADQRALDRLVDEELSLGEVVGGHAAQRQGRGQNLKRLREDDLPLDQSGKPSRVPRERTVSLQPRGASRVGHLEEDQRLA